MCERILVAYGSRFGSTAEVAEAIGMCLEQAGTFADVCSVDDVKDVNHYQAVVLGSAIRGGRWLAEAVQFLEAHRAELSQVPVAYFTVCMTLTEDTPENRLIVQEYHNPLLRDFPEVRPVSIGSFSGALHYRDLSESALLLTRAAQFPKGDFRNWELIRDWTLSVQPLLVGQLQPS